MSETPCGTCSRIIADGATICAGCAYRIDEGLADIAGFRGLGHDLDIAVAKQAVMGGRSGSRPAVMPLPYNTAASDASRALRAVLVSWTRLVIEETRADTLPADTLTGVAVWLRPWVGWLRHHPAAVEAYAEILDAVHQARRAVDRPADLVYAGPCDCGEHLYARFGAEYVTCRSEQHEDAVVWEMAARRAWLLASVEDVLATTTEISRALSAWQQPVTTNMIYGWVHRGRLTSRGERVEHGRRLPLYRVGDCLDIIARQGEQVAS